MFHVKHLPLLALLLAPTTAAAQGPIPCNQWNFIHDAGATPMTQFVMGDPLRRIGICGYTLIASGNAATFQLAYGTGTNCATGQTPLSPVIGLPNGCTLVNRNPDIVERTPPGQNLCAVATGSGTLDIIVYWAFF